MDQLDRTVLSPNGVVLDHHQIYEITHNYNAGFTRIAIQSWSDSYPEMVDNTIDIILNDSLTLDAAYVILAREWPEYVDPNKAALQELLPILTDEQAEEHSSLYPDWDANNSYQIGDRALYSGKLYRCIQAHAAQDSWNPADSPSLWVRTGVDPENPEAVPQWIQPTGSADAYNTGDRVIFDNAIYESLIDANVWSPIDYPSGWKLISE